MPQTQWVKATVACASFVFHTRKEGLGVIDRMYKVSDKINGSSFRIMEAMYCPEDYHKVVSELALEETISIATFKAAVYRVLSARWLQWCICHPEVGDDRVHPSRSMLPFGFVFGCCVMHLLQ